MSSKKDKTKMGDKEDDREGGTGGQAGSIEFRDFITGNTGLRDDNLPPDELRRIRAVHNIAHESRVKKQKELRAYRQDLKEGKVSLAQHREGLANEMSSKYPPHPALSNKAQFSGIDRQENPVPTNNEVQTNDENRNELEEKYQLRHRAQPKNAPKFNPKPNFP
jgi:hypothetical protein